MEPDEGTGECRTCEKQMPLDDMIFDEDSGGGMWTRWYCSGECMHEDWQTRAEYMYEERR